MKIVELQDSRIEVEVEDELQVSPGPSIPMTARLYSDWFKEQEPLWNGDVPISLSQSAKQTWNSPPEKNI